jgi:hypothetical protein
MFDYEILEFCEYSISNDVWPGKVRNCDHPATHKVWWISDNGTLLGKMFVCTKHFEFIKKNEMKNNDTV